MSGDPSTMMTSADRALLREFLSLDPERRAASDVVRRLGRARWTASTIAALTQLSVAEVTEILRRERTR